MRATLDRIKIRRATPTPPPAPPTAPPTQLGMIEQTLTRFGLPGVLITKAIEDFQSLRPWWPILIPILLWEARKTYIRERRAVLAQRRTTTPPSA